MTRNDEKHLFSLQHTQTGELHRVMLWKNYGVVCPTLWSMNGELRPAARFITDVIKDRRFVVVESSLPVGFNFTDYVTLLEKFISLNKSWSKPQGPQRSRTQTESPPESGWVLGVLKLTETE